MTVAGGMFPHPPIIIPEVGGRKRVEAEETINACQELSEEIADEDPDLILFSGPHGQAARDEITIPKAEELTGDMGQFNAADVELTVSSSPQLVSDLTEEAAAEGWAVKTLSDRVSVHLDHGVLVPLYFLQRAGLKDVPWIIINMAFWPPEKLFGFGQFLSEFLVEEDALFVCSGDLSHRLKPGSPGGYDPEGEKFDRRLMELLREEKIHEIIDMDENMREKAGECGYRPLLIGLGFCHCENLNIEVKSYEGPFGVGYGVAGFYVE